MKEFINSKILKLLLTLRQKPRNRHLWNLFLLIYLLCSTFTKYDTKEIISMEERTKGARNGGKIGEGMQNKSKDKKL